MSSKSASLIGKNLQRVWRRMTALRAARWASRAESFVPPAPRAMPSRAASGRSIFIVNCTRPTNAWPRS